MASLAPAFAILGVGPQTPAPRAAALAAAEQSLPFASPSQESQSTTVGRAILAAAAAVATGLHQSRRTVRTARRAAKVADDEEAPSSFWDAASARVGRRASLGVVATAAGAVVASPALAKDYSDEYSASKIDQSKVCIECASKGLIKCGMCTGTGQYRLFGTAMDSTSMNQYTECPECYGLGEKICTRCSGTGLPGSMLKGYMRDPVFAKVVYRLKRQRLDVNTVDKMRADVKQAMAAYDKRKAEKDAAKEASA
eukprot:gb/GFBE01064646.1/.p1 GENE.gb/GFBE01064646.1/~~gb/GFBE01064646.1/.p1  ORF type:complete len:254 (+),score=61.89 gb/GFBE01064646.1/:1-762(+)